MFCKWLTCNGYDKAMLKRFLKKCYDSNDFDFKFQQEESIKLNFSEIKQKCL